MDTDLGRFLPDDLSDEAAAQIIDLLYAIALMLEIHYDGTLRRYYRQNNPRQIELWD